MLNKLDDQLNAISKLVAELDGPAKFKVEKRVDQSTGGPIVCGVVAYWEVLLDEIDSGEGTTHIFTYGDIDG